MTQKPFSCQCVLREEEESLEGGRGKRCLALPLKVEQEVRCVTSRAATAAASHSRLIF